MLSCGSQTRGYRGEKATDNAHGIYGRHRSMGGKDIEEKEGKGTL
jgi:hypothetical protein